MDSDTPYVQATRDTGSGPAATRPTRRRFLKGGLFALLLPLLSGCTEILTGLGNAALMAFYPKKLSPFGSKITLPGTIADYPLDSVTVVREGKFYLSHVPDGLLALYWKCTHLGCTVPWKPSEKFEGDYGVFHCPCHGSTYLRTGQNVAGPTQRPLDIMAIELSGNNIIVDTGNITKRTRYDPEQATKV
ncbi:MAG TPA: ubiquinol-cytochrome c reductase iron-sulfur subunit [Chloroflexia bacterium]|nr:ubiquinol-cytochrome c reductase iron-sulfur subunit [Chloroflexia bacterium]